jgi:3-oxoacyl-(acyl-carrier-protein) synthase
VRGRALGRTVHTAVVNAFAFGGANTSLVLRGVA